MIGDLLNYYLIFGTKWSTYNHSEPLTAIAINGTTVTYKSILDFGIELNGHIHIHVDIVGGCKPLQYHFFNPKKNKQTQNNEQGLFNVFN